MTEVELSCSSITTRNIRACAGQAFRTIHIDRKPGETLGRAVITGPKDKLRVVGSHAYQSLTVDNGENALVLAKTPKGGEGEADLLYIEPRQRGSDYDPVIVLSRRSLQRDSDAAEGERIHCLHTFQHWIWSPPTRSREY
jgi:hypothetical protein